MSGHSHAKTIRRVKEAHDAQRGKIFSKMARVISVAAREGDDPETNAKLRGAIEEAKRLGVPKENIEKAIRRGTGKEGAKLEPVTYEAYGPGRVALIIEGITDNKNRTLAEIRQILQKHGGKLAEAGSVKWLFVRKGTITIIPQDQPAVSKEDLEMASIESGAEDTYWHKTEDVLDVYTKPGELAKVKRNLESRGIKIDSASLDWVAKEQIEIPEKERQGCQKLFEDLDESEAVQDIFSNLKI